jgi:hypothetical protein
MNPITKIFESVEQWYRMLGPAFLTLAILLSGLGYFIYKMYTFNIGNKIVNSFPSQFAINLYFGFAITAGFLIVAIVIFQSVAFHQYQKTTNNAPQQ